MSNTDLLYHLTFFLDFFVSFKEMKGRVYTHDQERQKYWTYSPDQNSATTD